MRILETFWLEEPGIQIDRQPKSFGAGSAPVQHFGRNEVGPDHHRWIGTHEAADYLGISLDALHRLTAARSIPSATAA